MFDFANASNSLLHPDDQKFSKNKLFPGPVIHCLKTNYGRCSVIAKAMRLMTYVCVCRLPSWPISRRSRNQRRATGGAPDRHRPHGPDVPRCCRRGRTAGTRDGQAKRGHVDTSGALLCAFFTGNNNHCYSSVDIVIGE